MNAQSVLKTLGLATVTALSLATGLAQADYGFAQLRFGADNPYLADSYTGPGPQGPYFATDAARTVATSSASSERRQAMQRDRIDHGVARGEITRREAAKLYREQEEIDQMQRYFLADRHLSRGEYATLDEALDRAGQNIRHQAHDNEWRW